MCSRSEVIRSRFCGSELSIRYDPNSSRLLSEAFEGQSTSFGELTDASGSFVARKACYPRGHHKPSVTLFLLSLLPTQVPLFDGLLPGKQQVARVRRQSRSRHTYLLSTE